ncbi:hypothetical protein [Mucilaginibacter sp.]|uniref:hypothetical protein n=1 Tax=Mucilaginibacter sp. TaxID=1882438 RepID=UPI0026181520|nr:hypothetical protein [Mucilaginibacter sp.]MDB4918279.1 hypothetical protein [Mucilaginibacter sp.]
MTKKTNSDKMPELVSAYEFAERRDVANTAVYAKIAKGDILTVTIGKHKYIDWELFKHVTFPMAEKRKAKKAAENNL